MVGGVRSGKIKNTSSRTTSHVQVVAPLNERRNVHKSARGDKFIKEFHSKICSERVFLLIYATKTPSGKEKEQKFSLQGKKDASQRESNA